MLRCPQGHAPRRRALSPLRSFFCGPCASDLSPSPVAEGYSGMGSRHETKNGVVYITVHESGPVLHSWYRVKSERQRREPKARSRPQRSSVLVRRRSTKSVNSRPILAHGRFKRRVFKRGIHATTTGAKQGIGRSSSEHVFSDRWVCVHAEESAWCALSVFTRRSKRVNII